MNSSGKGEISMQRETVFRAMEKLLNERAAETGEQVDELMRQLEQHAGSAFATEELSEQELERQVAFLQKLLQHEQEKTDAQQAMQQALEKLAQAMQQLGEVESATE